MPAKPSEEMNPITPRQGTHRRAKERPKNAANASTERRRQQNKITSRNYREKRKRKLELLEQLLPALPQVLAPTTAPSGSTEQRHDHVDRAESESILISQPTLAQTCSLVDLHQSRESTPLLIHNGTYSYPGNVGGASENSHENSSLTDLHWSGQGIGISPLDFGTVDLMTGNGLTLDTRPLFDQLGLSSTPNETSHILVNAGHALGSEDFSIPWRPSRSQQECDQPNFQQFANKPRDRDVQTHRPYHGRTKFSVSTYTRHYTQLGHDERARLLRGMRERGLRYVDVLASLEDANGIIGQFSFLTDDQQASVDIPSTRDSVPFSYEGYLVPAIPELPDLHRNNFRIKQASYWAAMYANAKALGFGFDDYLDEEILSPIFVPSVSGEDHVQIEKTSKKFSSVTPCLRPVAAQITKRHHLYVDVIPFPSFRERALAALSADPPLIDEDELCVDLMNDGLVCWGSHDSGAGMDAGVPWDTRSWEPQPWFLKKYWFLVGDQDEEMWSSTKWWYGMRGEKLNLGQST